MAQWTLEKIAKHARLFSLLTDENGATDDQVYEAIDDFVLYDMPYRVQLDILKENIRFTCNPNIGNYKLDSTAIVTELVDFDQKYTIIDQPMYCAGYAIRFYQDKSIFKSVYDNTLNFTSISTGDGVTDTFSTALSAPIEQYSLLVSSVGSNKAKIVAVDKPDNENPLSKNNAETGIFVDGLYEDPNDLVSSVNYITGAIEVTFGTAPANGEPIEAQYRTYSASRPEAMLYYNSELWLRPIPDKPYVIEFQAQVRPSTLKEDNPASVPELNQWGEYIAYGAALKLLSYKSNNERMQIIMPDFMRLEEQVRTRTYRQSGTRRTFTIFAEQAESQVRPWGGYKEPY